MSKGKPPKAPTSVSQTTIPEWARPYAESMLGGTQKFLFDINDKNEIIGMKPMAQYGGPGADTNRVADFAPMEKYAAARAESQGTNTGGIEGLFPQYQGARDAIGGIGARAGSMGYSPGSFGVGFNPSNFAVGYNQGDFAQRSFTDPGTAQSYMSPYMQSVVDINKREAIRDAGIQDTYNAAQATQAGGLGGARDALVRAEAQRNLGTRLSDIQNTGNQAAFQAAEAQFNNEMARNFSAQQAREQAKQFGTSASLQAQQMGEQSRQYGAGLGMQAQQLGEQSRQFGANVGLQALQQQLNAAVAQGQMTQQEAAQRLQMGQQQFGQEMGITGQLAQFGGIQRAAGQQGIENAYQDYVNAQNFPYRNYAFMSDMLRGLPLSDTSIYQAPPSGLSQALGIGAAGLGAYGAYNQFR